MGDAITRRRLFLGRGAELNSSLPAHPAGPTDGAAVRTLASVSDACVETAGTACRLCATWCEVDAISFRPLGHARAEIRIDVERCNGCGACVDPCPTGAILLVAAPPALSPSPVEFRP